MNGINLHITCWKCNLNQLIWTWPWAHLSDECDGYGFLFPSTIFITELYLSNSQIVDISELHSAFSGMHSRRYCVARHRNVAFFITNYSFSLNKCKLASNYNVLY